MIEIVIKLWRTLKQPDMQGEKFVDEGLLRFAKYRLQLRKIKFSYLQNL